MKPDRSHLIVALTVIVGLVLRLVPAFQSALNPDEAQIFFISEPANWMERSLAFHHPPLFFLLVHCVQTVSDSEIALRLVPVLAGSFFPLVVYVWLRRLGFSDAGLTSLLLLTFSPNLISLSAQMRGYTLALLFAALALYFLDAALEDRSVRGLLIHAGFLYLAIATEYSVLFAVAALGMHALVQLFLRRGNAGFWYVWAAIQMGGIAIYVALYMTSVANLVQGQLRDSLVAGYLRGGFPKPGENLIAFAFTATTKQFAYLFSSIPAGVVCACLFGAGMVFLWRRRLLRPWIAVLGLPFVFALFAALAGVHPYGRTRHCAILGLFAAPGIGLGLSWLSSGLRLPLAMALTLAIYIAAAEEPQNVPSAARPRTRLLAAIAELKQRIPAGAIILADEETTFLLKYYVGPRHANLDSILSKGLHREELNGLQVYSDGWDHRSVDRAERVAADLRRKFALPQNQPAWVVDGGFARIEERVNKAELIHQCLLVFPIPPLP